MNPVSTGGMPRAVPVSLLDQLAQTEGYFAEREGPIHAFIPEAGRFGRLRDDAKSILERLPEALHSLPLLGLMVGVKDIFRVDGLATQAGSRLPASEFGGEEAESVTRLKNAGALILGKTVTTEFAYFTPGPTRNPHNLEHTPGGSSSGSAAAVAAGLCDVALGTQTIGSIIRPASFCGVIGLKPTYDRIWRAGVIPLSPSLDHVGFFTAEMETAQRAARALLTGWNEWTGGRKPVLAVPRGSYLESVSSEGRLHFEQVCQRLSSRYQILELEVFPDFQEIRTRHDVILAAEAARVHSKWFEQYQQLYSSKFAELIRRGQSITDSQLESALLSKDRFCDGLTKLMSDSGIDAWICPSSVGSAPRGLDSTGDPVMNLPWTQAGLPCINLPAGRSGNGLPLGLQVVAAWNQDEALLAWSVHMREIVGAL